MHGRCISKFLEYQNKGLTGCEKIQACGTLSTQVSGQKYIGLHTMCLFQPGVDA